ncbi:hypothetical protein QFC19_002750 [Naganishia cerealis]|uniref:Uncharacterized protein n=1 Tax=Naganishia cerealis TaxID=610337 RepID=A0ACC2W7U8_9TREE|nr:hypothetical protein QFC19_002750 [Naganishia cerealis]
MSAQDTPPRDAGDGLGREKTPEIPRRKDRDSTATEGDEKERSRRYRDEDESSARDVDVDRERLRERADDRRIAEDRRRRDDRDRGARYDDAIDMMVDEASPMRRSPPPRETRGSPAYGRRPSEVGTPKRDEAEALLQDVDSETRSIFVSQLAAALTSKDVGMFFEEKLGKGSVRDARVVTDRITRRSKGVAYVELASVELVAKALTLSGTIVMGLPIMTGCWRSCRICWYAPRPTPALRLARGADRPSLHPPSPPPSQWAPVMQYSDREMSNMCFNHLLDLSLSFHTKRKTGEVLRILDRGSAINSFFQVGFRARAPPVGRDTYSNAPPPPPSQTLLFSVLPVLFDISIAIAVFYFVYGSLLAIIIGTVMFSYIFISITLTTWRTKLRREMNDRDVITRGIHTDVLMNWETVKYFTSEARESARYREAVHAYQVKEYQVVGSLNLLNLTQNFIITAGLLAGSLVVSYRITQGKSDAAEFIVFITYLGQLYAPLHMLGMIYRQLNSGMVDAEKLLRLLEEETEIVDAPNAKDLVVTDGVIEFRDVHFSYDGKVKALDGVSFRIDKGTSVALVGESGSGKSTILRLLFRFYEIGSGAILIDGQDIREVTQVSLRRALGVVPQESVLWNDTIEYNIGYGRQGASKEEIVEAAKAARLHDRIMSFPEREFAGQARVAWTYLTLSPPFFQNTTRSWENEAFVCLEVKSSEWRSLGPAEGRSSLMIAHRLSTIVSCDQIIVMRNGKIIERGNHRDLLAREDGVFAGMWNQQISVDSGMAEEAVKAEQLVDVKISDEQYKSA